MKSPVPRHVNKDDTKSYPNGCGSIWDLITSDFNPHTSIDYCLMDAPSEKHRHHRAFEFYCITKGTGTVYVGKEMFKVKPGSVVQIPPEIDHYVIPNSELELFVVSTPPFSQTDYIPTP